jgi:hypothetical protein
MAQTETPQLVQSINTLEARVQSVQTLLAAQPEPPTPELANLVNRLT